MLEGFWCIGQANGDNQILIQALRCQKSSFMFVTFTYANLVVSMAQVDGAEHSGLAQTVKQVCNTGNWEYI